LAVLALKSSGKDIDFKDKALLTILTIEEDTLFLGKKIF